MSEATVRARLNTIISDVTDIGNVYDYQRWAVLWDDFINFYKTTINGSTVIRGWTITTAGWPVSDYLDGSYVEDDGETVTIREYIYKIRGYIGVDDANASEKTAIALVEDVVEALDNDTNLHAWADIDEIYWGEQPPATVDIFEPRLFGSHLVHFTEITQIVREAVKLT